MTDKKPSVCVYCGAQDAVPSHFLDEGRAFGKSLAEKGIRLVYGGGDCGMMGAIANAVMENGGEVIGVFPKELRGMEDEHKGLTEIYVVNGMHERKQLMFDHSDGFIAFPGGFGTLDETFEMITWRQLEFHDKPIIIYNYEGYWQHWVDLANNIIDTGFAVPRTRECYEVVDRMDDILPAIFGYLDDHPKGRPPF